MFKELPAWGFYIRHAKDLKFENISLSALTEDYRTSVVLDDVHGITFNSLRVTEPGGKKEPVFSYRSTDVVLNNK